MDIRTFGNLVILSDGVSGTLATGKKVYIRVPGKLRLVEFAAWLETTGAGSGSTTVALKNGTTTLHNGVSIAYNAANPYTADGTFASADVSADSWITAEVTAVPGTASSGLHVQITAVGLD